MQRLLGRGRKQDLRTPLQGGKVSVAQHKPEPRGFQISWTFNLTQGTTRQPDSKPNLSWQQVSCYLASQGSRAWSGMADGTGLWCSSSEDETAPCAFQRRSSVVI